MAKKKKEEPPQRRKRRGIEQRIAELEAKISAIKAREALKQAKSDPALKHATAAIRSIDKALAEASEGATREALSEARTLLSSCLTPGGSGSVRTGRRGAGQMEELGNQLLDYVRGNPGQRGEQIAAALLTDANAIRPAMKRLIADGKIVTEGQKRGMTYSAV